MCSLTRMLTGEACIGETSTGVACIFPSSSVGAGDDRVAAEFLAHGRDRLHDGIGAALGGQARSQRGGDDRGGYTQIDRVMQRPPAFAGVLRPGGDFVPVVT